MFCKKNKSRIMACLTIFMALVFILGSVGCASKEPTVQPTAQPTVQPTVQPTAQPTVQPTAQPTVQPTAQPTAQRKIVVRVHSQMPAGNHITEAIELFIGEAQDKSKGTFVMQHFLNQQLLKSTNAGEMTIKGAVEIAQLASVGESVVPEIRFLNSGGIFANMDQTARFVNNPDVSRFMDERFQAKGLKLLGWLLYSTDIQWFFKDKVDSMAAWKGKKIRSAGTSYAEFMKAMGAAPVGLSSSEMYDAMQRRTIDGLMTGWTSFTDRKLYEVCSYAVEFYWGPGVWPVVANLTFWNGLTPELQKVLLDAAATAQKWDWVASVKEEAAAKQEAIKRGIWVWEIVDKPEGAETRRIANETTTKLLPEIISKESIDKLYKWLEQTR